MINSINKMKTAVVTGAAGVLGRATVKMLTEENIRVVMIDLDKGKLDSISSEISGETYSISCNLSSYVEIEQASKMIEEKFGAVDILVNNAGILSNNKFEATTEAEWLNVMAVNLNSVFYLSSLLIPGMKRKGWGRIVNTSSLAAKTGGITAGTAYSTSKGAVMSLTFSLAAELASFGITVNGIAPAYVKTPMITEQLTEEQRIDLIDKIPVGRFCEPEEFAHTVKFLIDPLAGFITGEIIDQNGGLLFD